MMLFGRLQQQSGRQLRGRLQRIQKYCDNKRNVRRVELGRVLLIAGAIKQQRQQEVDHVGQTRWCGYRDSTCLARTSRRRRTASNHTRVELLEIALVLQRAHVLAHKLDEHLGERGRYLKVVVGLAQRETVRVGAAGGRVLA